VLTALALRASATRSVLLRDLPRHPRGMRIRPPEIGYHSYSGKKKKFRVHARMAYLNEYYFEPKF
jgi:hypothetical protein